MKAIEFEAELGGTTLALPAEVAERLPAAGWARVVVFVDEEEESWRLGSYEQFMRDDAPEDAVYDQFA